MFFNTFVGFDDLDVDVQPEIWHSFQSLLLGTYVISGRVAFSDQPSEKNSETAFTETMRVCESTYVLVISAPYTQHYLSFEKLWVLVEVRKFLANRTHRELMLTIKHIFEVENFTSVYFMSTLTSNVKGMRTIWKPYVLEVRKLDYSLSLVYNRLQNFSEKLKKNLLKYLKYLDSVQKFLSKSESVKSLNVLTYAVRRSFYIPCRSVFREGVFTKRLKLVLAGFVKTCCGISCSVVLDSGLKLQVDRYQYASLEGAGNSGDFLVWRNWRNDEGVIYWMTRFVDGAWSANTSSVRAFQLVADALVISIVQLDAGFKLLPEQFITDGRADDMFSGANNKVGATLVMEFGSQCLRSGAFKLCQVASTSLSSQAILNVPTNVPTNVLPGTFREKVQKLVICTYYDFGNVGIESFPFREQLMIKNVSSDKFRLLSFSGNFEKISLRGDNLLLIHKSL